MNKEREPVSNQTVGRTSRVTFSIRAFPLTLSSILQSAYYTNEVFFICFNGTSIYKSLHFTNFVNYCTVGTKTNLVHLIETGLRINTDCSRKLQDFIAKKLGHSSLSINAQHFLLTSVELKMSVHACKTIR